MIGAAEAQSPGNAQQTDSQQQNAQTKQAEPTPPKADIRIVPVQPQRSDKSLAETKVYEPDCGKPKDQPDADLCVQRRVADAAESALHWTQIQTGGALVGLVLVLATLGVTAWTGKAASIAAQAAVDTVGAERAWMSFDGIQQANGSNIVIEDGHVEASAHGISLKWKNTGRSPSLKTGVSVECGILEAGSEIPRFIDKAPDTGRTGTIGPGMTVYSRTNWFYGDVWRKFERGEIDFVFWSTIKYTTTFNRKIIRETEVTLKISHNGQQADDKGELRPNYAILVTGPQNDAT